MTTPDKIWVITTVEDQAIPGVRQSADVGGRFLSSPAPDQGGEGWQEVPTAEIKRELGALARVVGEALEEAESQMAMVLDEVELAVEVNGLSFPLWKQ